MDFYTKSLKVVVAVEEQYLTTDILQAGVMERPVLPPNLETIRSAAAHFFKVFMLRIKRLTTLPGDLVLMVEQGLDIGNPAYGQLQKLHKVDTENVRVGGEEAGDASQAGYQATQGEADPNLQDYRATQGGRFAAAWEPKPSRALYITLTDGFHKVGAKKLMSIPISIQDCCSR